VADKVELEVTITTDGKVVIKTHGLKGETCLAETKDLEGALGKVHAREKTREAFERVAGTSSTAKHR
jgi:hypothetical protein